MIEIRDKNGKLKKLNCKDFVASRASATMRDARIAHAEYMVEVWKERAAAHAEQPDPRAKKIARLREQLAKLEAEHAEVVKGKPRG